MRRCIRRGGGAGCQRGTTSSGSKLDGKDVKVGGTSAEVVKKTSGGNWVYVIDSPYGTA